MAKKREKKLNSSYFLIRVDYRRHASLQGEVEWLDRDKRKVSYFRSFLELMGLLSEALEQNGYPEADYELKKWQESEDKKFLQHD